MSLPRLIQQQDFVSGLLLAGLGIGGLYVGARYPVGTAEQMGPGYFPKVLSIAIVIVGVWLMGKSLLAGDRLIERIHLRSVGLVVLAMVVFGLTIERAGLVIATLLLVAIAALGGHEARLREVVLVYLGLTLAATGLFIVGLGLPIRILPL